MMAIPVKKRISDDFQALIPCASEEMRTNTDDIIHKVPFMCCEIGFLITFIPLSADRLSDTVTGRLTPSSVGSGNLQKSS
jgi:hypothetical protein